mmetsp:Transcript_3893/g.6804  ORF Transcript_3893/g.6804 Transcript_3893/m.6804 type:complete len:188 (+) Transcript_3893:65-628(+)
MTFESDSIAQQEKNKSSIERCLKLRDKALTNPYVKFMMNELAKVGCPISPDSIQCQICDEKLLGGFQSDGSIILAGNHLGAQRLANQTLVHEMIHAFDQCRAKVDWTNCFHHACTEVRAATLSGDCNLWSEFMRMNFKVRGQFQKCIRRRAELSVSMNPNCESQAKFAVDTVFHSCYSDTMPFDRIP